MSDAAKPGTTDAAAVGGSASPRRSLLDLAPLELDCMNTLWPIGEGTVREIRDRLAPRRPRAYTTIMTIMDRLARKGVVERRKSGRAYVYRPNLSADDARRQALGQVIENFFGGSNEEAVTFLRANGRGIAHEAHIPSRAFAAKAGAAAAASPVPHAGAPAPIVATQESSLALAKESRSETRDDETVGIDETLL